MKKIGLIIGIAAAATASHAAERLSVADCFLGAPGAASITDTEIGQASWSTVCGDGCCADACGDDVCGDACGEGCCDSVGCCGSICGGCPCAKNCGLLGKGILTYNPCGEAGALPELVFGKLFCESEGCFDDFISPMTNPIHFEDPRTLSELRTIFWQHKVPLTAGGGDINLYAVQIRAALSDRLSLIATKDGYVVSTNPLIDDGWADLDIGLKYNFYRDVRNQRLATAGFTYSAPFGSPRTLQGRGDGSFHLFATGGTQVGECGHWLSALGGVLPVDDEANSHFMYWSNHYDYQVRKGWYALAELNWFHWTDGGADQLGVTGVEGLDAFKLGSGGVDGNDIVTGAIGVKYKPSSKYEIGLAWEVPLTDRRDVIDNRLTVDLILRY